MPERKRLSCLREHRVQRQGCFYEVMPITEEVRELILMGASTAEIKNQAISQGMKTLRQSGLTKILDGTTSVSEILRTTMAD